MRTYKVSIQGKAGDVMCELPSATYRAIEASSQHEALERAMLLYELDTPHEEPFCYWAASIDGVPFRLFWFIVWNPITGKSNYPHGLGAVHPMYGLTNVPSREV